MKSISTLLSLLTVPASMYIQYSLLQAIHADRLLMFLFWANWPIIMIVLIMQRIIDRGEK